MATFVDHGCSSSLEYASRFLGCPSVSSRLFSRCPSRFNGRHPSSGGVTLLLQLLISEKKAWLWTSIGGVLLNLTIACALVYALTAFVGLMTLAPDVQSLRPTAIILLFYAASLFYLAVSLRLIPAGFPASRAARARHCAN